MNKFQEISAGLVLLFGGDGPAAQRAGDALLADRIAEAVEEGGFSAISYGHWRKSEESASLLEFEAIRLARGPGAVNVAEARMEVFSQSLSFFDGDFTSTDTAQRWRFERVEIVRGGFFSRQLRVSAFGLDPQPASPAPDCETDAPHCALRAVGSGPVDRFHMLFRSRDRDAVVTLAWQAGPSCWLAWTPAGRGSADLASWGRGYLNAPETVSFRITATDCRLPDVGEVEDVLEDQLDDARTAEDLAGGEVMAAAPVLVRTLFGLVAESYAYLLE